eukprot:g1918.t1
MVGNRMPTRRRAPHIWLDKCCIDQNDIEADLRCLPIFLSGCAELVVFCGPTYLSRLWCVMELFTFVHIGGNVSEINVIPVLRPWDDAQAMAERPAVPPVLPRLSKDVFTTAPPWPQSARVKERGPLPGLDKQLLLVSCNTSERVAKMAGQSPSWAPQHGWAVFEAEEAPLTAILAILPTWASLALAFSAFAFAIVASTQALLYWETIHWPWSRIKRSPRDVSSMWDPTSLAASKLQYDSLARREELLMKRQISLVAAKENAPWQEHAEQLRDLLKGGYLSLDSITSSDGMLDFFASHRVLAHQERHIYYCITVMKRQTNLERLAYCRRMQECLSCCLGIRMTVHYNLFCGTVLALGNEEQCRWLEESQTRGQLGCFMLTEVGAGVLSGLVVETTATWTWDAEGGGFDLHTPSASAEKTWSDC